MTELCDPIQVYYRCPYDGCRHRGPANRRAFADGSGCRYTCPACGRESDIEFSSPPEAESPPPSIGARCHVRTAREVDAALDMVNNPPHYQGKGGMQAIDVIEAFELGYCLGNVIKYVLRAGKKGETKEDIEKAIWYLERYAKTL